MAFGCSVAFAIVIYVQLVSFSFLISSFGGLLFVVVDAVVAARRDFAVITEWIARCSRAYPN